MKKIYFLLFLAFSTGFCIQKASSQCQANFSFTASGNTATFTDMSTASPGTVFSWGWSFGDGTFSSSQNPSHTYPTCGVYNVSLTIATTAFCTNTYSTTLTVNGGISPSFTYNIDTTNGNVTFQPNPLAMNLNYIWDLGDGSADSNVFVNHTYPSGLYTVCLTVTDDSAICSATYCDTLNVVVVPPGCNTTFTYNDNGGGNVTFQVDPFDFGHTYTWDFGDTTSGTGGFTFHGYPSAGTYIVCLTTVDSSTMCTSNFCDTITLSTDPTNCDVAFTPFNNNGQVSFFANSFSANNTYSWTFGDGNTATGNSVNNTYINSGTYYVCLTTTNSFDACSATYCDSVDVVIAGISELNQDPFSLQIFPNPASNNFSVSFNSKDEEVILELIDITGRSILYRKTKGNNSTQIADFNSEELDQGIYFIRISSAAGNTCVKVIISK